MILLLTKIMMTLKRFYLVKMLKNRNRESYDAKVTEEDLDRLIANFSFRCFIAKHFLNVKHSILSFEKSYFGINNRVCGFKALTLWVHHPGMWHMKRLASMDCKREMKDMVVLFFRLFNSALQDFTGDPVYSFYPVMVVTDEGAIHQGLHDIFGHD